MYQTTERVSVFYPDDSYRPLLRSNRPPLTTLLARVTVPSSTTRYQTTERVSVIYSDDTYGPIAASAFARAARSTIGINVDYNAAGQSPSTIDIAAT